MLVNRYSNMSERLLKYVIIFAVLCRVRADCHIEDLHDECNYTIACESAVSPAPLPACARPNPTLLIKNSSVETLSSKFFNGSNFNDHVIALKAVNNRWTHIKPFAFTFAPCILMDLSGNGIKSVHSDSFRRVFLLRELNLSRNALDTWDLQCISDSGVPMNISVLDLSFNFLTNLTMEKMACFPELRKLYLQGNKFSFLPEGVFANLINLNYLSLSNNQLTTVLGTLDFLRKLKFLNVSVNRVKELSARDLIDSESLEQIIVSRNEIETVDYRVFDKTINLQTIDLSNNYIKSLILTLINNTEIKSLNFHNNNISIINCTLSPSSKNLETIDFSSNALSELLAGAIRNAQNLKVLNLSSNYLTNTRDVSLGEFKNLTVLDLSNNGLVELDVKAFSDCLNLKRLIVDNNSIKKIDFDNLVEQLPHLEVISLGGNLIPCHEMSEHYDKGLWNSVNVTATEQVLDRSNVYGISCDNSTKPGGFKNAHEPINLMTLVVIWLGLMVLIIVVLLISGVWTCISKSRRPRHTTYIMEPSGGSIKPSESTSWQEVPVESRL